jgi:DNA-binding transcriptional LysR family regulator
MMDLDDLQIFRSVVHEGGVTRAARHLHRVPSNVTTRIKQLEERLGVPLFQRRGRGLVLTDSGRVLMGHAERLLQMADTAERELRGVLRLGSLESAAGVRLPPLLSGFHAEYPEVSIELQTGTTQALLARLERFEIEAAFVSEPFEHERYTSVPVFQEQLVLISARGEPRPRRAADLSQRTLVTFPNGCSYRRRLLEWLAAEGVTPGKVLDLASYHAIVACVAAGIGVGIVPAELLEQAVMATDVEQHPLPARLRVNRTQLVWSGEPSEPLKALIAMMPKQGSVAAPTRTPVKRR